MSHVGGDEVKRTCSEFGNRGKCTIEVHIGKGHTSVSFVQLILPSLVTFAGISKVFIKKRKLSNVSIVTNHSPIKVTGNVMLILFIRKSDRSDVNNVAICLVPKVAYGGILKVSMKTTNLNVPNVAKSATVLFH